jgi:hypothetical protein
MRDARGQELGDGYLQVVDNSAVPLAERHRAERNSTARRQTRVSRRRGTQASGPLE